MPLVDYQCGKCGKRDEYLVWQGQAPPECCGETMTRCWSLHGMRLKDGPPLWTSRIDDIHKAQEQRGERLRFVHPREVRAT